MVPLISVGILFLGFGILVLADRPRRFATRAITFADRAASLRGDSERDPLLSRMFLGALLVAAGLLCIFR